MGFVLVQNLEVIRNFIFLIVLRGSLGSSTQNHAEALWKYVKKCLLDPKDDNFNNMSKFGSVGTFKPLVMCLVHLLFPQKMHCFSFQFKFKNLEFSICVFLSA